MIGCISASGAKENNVIQVIEKNEGMTQGAGVSSVENPLTITQAELDFISSVHTAVETKNVVQCFALLEELEMSYPNHSIKNEIIYLLSNIDIIRFLMPAETVKGSPFKSEFIAKVIWRDTKESIASVPVEIQYPVSNKNGKLEYAVVNAVSDEKGLISVMPELPQYACNGMLTMRFDVPGENLFLWVDIAPYKVATSVRGKPGAISLVDFTKSGSPIINNSKSSSVLLTALVRRGFTRIGIADFTAPIVAGHSDGVYSEAKKLFGSSTQFLIYGTVKYEKAEQTGDGFMIALVADITVLDLMAKNELYKIISRAQVIAKNEYEALEAARQALLVDDIAEQLIYGM